MRRLIARRKKRGQCRSDVPGTTRTRVPAARPLVHALLDRHLLQSMGFRPAPEWLSRVVPAALRLRAAVLRRLPPRRRPRYLTELPRPSYPSGYRIETLE